MASSRQIIPCVFDQSTISRKVVSGTLLKNPDSNQEMRLVYGTQALFQATIYSVTITEAFNPADGATWAFGLDNVPFSDVTDFVYSANDQFNIEGDWVDMLVASGKICWRADLATAELKAGLNLQTSASPTMYGNLWMLTDIGNMMIASWPITILKPYFDPSTAKPVTDITHLTTDAAAASYVPLWGDNAYVRRKNGRDQYLFPDGKWRTKYHTLTDGEPTETWGDPED